MDSSTHTVLSGCVSSLRSSMQLLESSINVLDSGVNDYPRLAKVLQTTTHFELVSEHDLTTAQAALVSEIQPEVSNLLSRVESHLEALARRERSLIARTDLLQGRMSRPTPRTAGGGAGGAASGARAKGGGSVIQPDEIKLQQLRAKKERLAFAIGRLELQVGQRQRQLRKSMALKDQMADF